jgi:ribosomal protein L22
MSAKKTVIIVYTANQVQKGRDIIKTNLKNRAEMVLIALNAETHYALKDNDIPHKNVEDYFNCDTFSNLDRESINLAKNWYKQECFSNLVNHEDISLTEITEWSFSNFFAYVIECIKMVELIIEMEKPKEIIIFDDWSGESNSIVPKSHENIPTEATVLVGDFHGIQVKKIRVECGKTDRDIAKIILKLVAEIFILFINLIQKHGRKDKKNILCLHSWSLVKSIFNKMNNTHLILSGLSANLIKDTFLEILRGNVSFKHPFYSSKKASGKSKKYQTKVEKKWLHIERSQPPITYQNYDLWPLIENKLKYVFFTHFPKIIKNIEMIKELLHKEKIDLIITSGIEVEEQRTFIIAAKKMNIKTLYLPHGILYTLVGFSPPLPVDKVAAWGEEEKRWLGSRGMDGRKMIATGSPHFDRYVTEKRPSREKSCYKLGLDPDKKTIVLATHHFERWVTIANQHLIGMEWYKFFKMVIASVEPFPDYQLVVKLHPVDEEVEIHKRMLKEISDKNIPAFQGENILFDFINVCDIWITYPSTTGLEAMILDKPVITLIPEGKEIRNNSILEAGLCVKSAQELKMAIEKIINNGETRKKLRMSQEKFIYEHAYKQDGKASKRVADLIEQMIEESRREKDGK